MYKFSEGIPAVSSIAAKVSLPQHGQTTQANKLHGSNDSVESKFYPDNVSLSSRDISFASIQLRNEGLYKIATNIRDADKIMSDVGRLIGEKRVEIHEYEKQYPPFQNQSSERIRFLNSIASLKRQVDALTLIPYNKELASIVGDTASREDQTFFDDKAPYPVRSHEVHSGPNGLNIASIKSISTDTEVRQFGRDLDNALHKLERRKAGLVHDARIISEKIIFYGSGTEPETIESEQELMNKSKEINNQLTSLHGQSIGTDQGIKLLETLR